MKDIEMRGRLGSLYLGSGRLALQYLSQTDYDRAPHLHIAIPGVQAFINLPWNHRSGGFGDEWRLGFYYFEKAFWFCYGKKIKAFHMPWSWVHVRREVLMADGTWFRFPEGTYIEDPAGRHLEKHPYTYTLRNGVAQNRTATIHVEEREWRWKWFKRLPWPRKVWRAIQINFDDEVGEGTGSWKGGCLGCGWTMLPGELPAHALRRMEKERKFSR